MAILISSGLKIGVYENNSEEEVVFLASVLKTGHVDYNLCPILEINPLRLCRRVVNYNSRIVQFTSLCTTCYRSGHWHLVLCKDINIAHFFNACNKM